MFQLLALSYSFYQGSELKFWHPEQNFDLSITCRSAIDFVYRKFSDNSRVITDIHDLFIETTDVGDSETY